MSPRRELDPDPGGSSSRTDLGAITITPNQDQTITLPFGKQRSSSVSLPYFSTDGMTASHPPAYMDQIKDKYHSEMGMRTWTPWAGVQPQANPDNTGEHDVPADQDKSYVTQPHRSRRDSSSRGDIMVDFPDTATVSPDRDDSVRAHLHQSKAHHHGHPGADTMDICLGTDPSLDTSYMMSASTKRKREGDDQHEEMGGEGDGTGVDHGETRVGGTPIPTIQGEGGFTEGLDDINASHFINDLSQDRTRMSSHIDQSIQQPFTSTSSLPLATHQTFSYEEIQAVEMAVFNTLMQDLVDDEEQRDEESRDLLLGVAQAKITQVSKDNIESGSYQELCLDGGTETRRPREADHSTFVTAVTAANVEDYDMDIPEVPDPDLAELEEDDDDALPVRVMTEAELEVLHQWFDDPLILEHHELEGLDACPNGVAVGHDEGLGGDLLDTDDRQHLREILFDGDPGTGSDDASSYGLLEGTVNGRAHEVLPLPGLGDALSAIPEHAEPECMEVDEMDYGHYDCGGNDGNQRDALDGSDTDGDHSEDFGRDDVMESWYHGQHKTSGSAKGNAVYANGLISGGMSHIRELGQISRPQRLRDAEGPSGAEADLQSASQDPFAQRRGQKVVLDHGLAGKRDSGVRAPAPVNVMIRLESALQIPRGTVKARPTLRKFKYDELKDLFHQPGRRPCELGKDATEERTITYCRSRDAIQMMVLYLEGNGLPAEHLSIKVLRQYLRKPVAWQEAAFIAGDQLRQQHRYLPVVLRITPMKSWSKAESTPVVKMSLAQVAFGPEGPLMLPLRSNLTGSTTPVQGDLMPYLQLEIKLPSLRLLQAAFREKMKTRTHFRTSPLVLRQQRRKEPIECRGPQASAMVARVPKLSPIAKRERGTAMAPGRPKNPAASRQALDRDLSDMMRMRDQSHVTDGSSLRHNPEQPQLHPLGSEGQPSHLGFNRSHQYGDTVELGRTPARHIESTRLLPSGHADRHRNKMARIDNDAQTPLQIRDPAFSLGQPQVANAGRTRRYGYDTITPHVPRSNPRELLPDAKPHDPWA